jgi:hypothetical protein
MSDRAVMMCRMETDEALPVICPGCQGNRIALLEDAQDEWSEECQMVNLSMICHFCGFSWCSTGQDRLALDDIHIATWDSFGDLELGARLQVS